MKQKLLIVIPTSAVCLQLNLVSVIPTSAVCLQLNLVSVRVLASWQLKVKKQHMTVSEFCVILVKWQDRPFSKCLMYKSIQSFCMVQKYGAFSVLMWLRKSTPLLVNAFWTSHWRLQTNVCMGILEGTPCLSICVYELLNTGLNCYIWMRTGCQNKPTTCKLTWNWMANVVGHIDWGICCVNLALVLFSCKRVLGMKGPFWHFSRNDCDDFKREWTTAINSSERCCLYASFKSNLLTENHLDFVWIKCFRDVLIKLRMGGTPYFPLNANRFRYAHENASKILCSFCETEVKDEVHFICFCPLYKELHQKYIHRYLQTEHSFMLLMQCHEKSSSQNLAFFFVFHACKKRNICMLLK